MNDQNSNFEKDFTVGEKNYSYVFSEGTTAPSTAHPKKAKNHILSSLILITLCLCLGFSAGVGGMLVARHLFPEESKVEGLIPDDPNSVLTNNPESILDKSEPTQSIYGSAGADVFAVSDVARIVKDSVVVINASIISSSPFGNSTSNVGAGSGVILSEDGYIITCHHVVEGASSVKVTLNDGSDYSAVLVGSDEESDLAVIKIDPGEKKLTYAKQGCSGDLVVGESVVAIGNPLGILGGTVTTGIISATERNVLTQDGKTMTLLQTDTAINSGNSGGGLFNLDGQLIGIVNAKYSASGVEGLAFAIPIDSAYPVQMDLLQYGYVRGIVDHGLSVLEVTDANLRNYYYYYGISETGVYVVNSEYSSELANGDRIRTLNGKSISTVSEMEAYIKTLSVGDVLKVGAVREGREFEVSLTLREYVPDRLKNKDSIQ